MKTLAIGIALAMTHSTIGCVSLSKEAASVFIQKADSNLLDKCKKMGRVTGDSSGALTNDGRYDVATIRLREAAYKVGADTVVELNNDYPFMGKVVIYGIAYKCE